MPSPIEKLQKFLKLESERNFDNRAVVGGLDKILPSWEKEAKDQNLPDDLIQYVLLKISAYPSSTVEDRNQIVNDLISKIKTTENGSSPSIDNPISSRPEQPLPVRRERRIENVPPVNDHSQNQPVRPVKTRSPIQNHTVGASTIGLDAPLTVLPGIGPKNAQSFAQLGLSTLEHLLYYFPRRYDDYSNLKPINRLNYGDELTVIATVQSCSDRQIKNGKMHITEAIVSDGTGALRATWFNQPWLAKNLMTGTQVVLSGKVDIYLGRLCMNSPELEFLEQEHLHTNRIVPVYPGTAKVSQKMLRRMMHQTVTFWAPRVHDYLPDSIRNKAKLVGLSEALVQVHFPDSMELLKEARERLSFDEIFLLQLGVLRQKRNWQANTARVFNISEEWYQEQINRIPFELTGAQQKALQDIRTDLQSGRPMNRLLQGDVGSGKTMVASLAMLMVTSNGAQAALMAPTSILAEQHFRSLIRFFANPTDEIAAPLRPDEIRLLVGDTPESEKQEIRENLANGTIKIIVGTHALIEGPIEFNQLQLAVVDEQHRFGVAQRAALRSKGDNPHLLVMTATPIPRSLALTVYGDLDLTVMDQMPAGRQPIETHVLSPLERERAYQLIKSQIKEGYQAFVIYPLVEQGENEEVKAAVEDQERLQKEVFPQYKVGLLHGRMRPEDKENVMLAFRNGEFQILVSTSVIEVGVDVPNATVMLIEGANRFGLSQLHQFRGRVGRGSAKSYCLLIPDHEDKLENERLITMAETNDGFVLAERDLEQRGPGDFLGTRQAGFSDLRLASLTDVRLIEKARNIAQSVFEEDPDLSNPMYASLEKFLQRFWGNGRGDIS